MDSLDANWSEPNHTYLNAYSEFDAPAQSANIAHSASHPAPDELFQFTPIPFEWHPSDVFYYGLPECSTFSPLN